MRSRPYTVAMRRLGIHPAALALALTALLAASAASAQDAAAVSRTVYFGSVLNPTAAVAAATSSREPVILDLTLFADGFAYGRLMLPRRALVVAGGGSLRDTNDLRLVFRQEVPGLYGAWAAEFAHQPPGSTPATPAPDVVASFSGYRDYSFGSEGTLITGALAFSNEPTKVLNLELHRRAAYATWSFEQGRVSASFTAPYWYTAGSSVNDLLESTGRQRAYGFVAEGRAFDASGMLGWSWEMDEYVSLEGASGAYLSLLSHTNVYTGGAHPNTYFGSQLLEVRPSGVTELKVADLFRSDSTWLRRLTPLVLEKLAAQGAAWVTQGDVSTLTVNDLSVFTLAADGLTFYFAPYAMGPYVQGSFEVTIPYDQLLGLAPAGGALEAFATATPAR